jgi:hypothetical protein
MTEDRRPARARRALIAGACLFGAVALAGALLGPLWWALAPARAEGTALGDGEVFTGTSQAVFAGEGYFVVMTAIAGLVTGYAAYMAQFPLARRRTQDLRLVCLIAGFAGSAAAALLTWRIGVALDAPLHAAAAAAEPGDTLEVGLRLKATAFLVAWPFVFVLQYALLDLISLIRRDQPGVPVTVPAPADLSAAPQPDRGPDAQRAMGRSADPGAGQAPGTAPEAVPGTQPRHQAPGTPRTPAPDGSAPRPPVHRGPSDGEPRTDGH